MNKFGIGQPVRRVEDQRFLTGRGRFVDDINLPRQCYGVPVLSVHAHARIRGAAGVFAARRAASEKNGKRRGRAVSYYIEQGGVFNDRMELRFDPTSRSTRKSSRTRRYRPNNAYSAAQY
ncbi:MAG: hypothetical protein EXR27_17595 [Betaproteobacteria bacterium]|nr:hypothetical protein [Betaproteobacteria bacterium]